MRHTRAIVELDRLEANVRALCRLANPSDVMVVVKANAYGHGAVPVAKAALAAGASWLGVYTVEEGAELRAAGLKCPILVFGPFTEQEAERLVNTELTPTITTPVAGEWLARAAQERPVRFHLKIDTGLHRSGVAPEDAPSLLGRLARFPRLIPEGIYTHFASADEPDSSVTERQLRCFLEVTGRLRADGFTFRLRHAANSAAALAFPESRLSLVRCGIATYGYDPTPDRTSGVPLQPVLSLVSRVTRVHDIKPDEGVGYGHEFRATRSSRIVLAPVGYGDGLPRALGNGRGRVILRSRLAPIVGRVSMDQITIDATNVPEVTLDDPVVIIGSEGAVTQTAEDVALQAGTIGYEILTRLMPRVSRVYTGSRIA